jgi:hypothetical protein
VRGFEKCICAHGRIVLPLSQLLLSGVSYQIFDWKGNPDRLMLLQRWCKYLLPACGKPPLRIKWQHARLSPLAFQ